MHDPPHFEILLGFKLETLRSPTTGNKIKRRAVWLGEENIVGEVRDCVVKPEALGYMG